MDEELDAAMATGTAFDGGLSRLRLVATAATGEEELLARLRSGDEASFRTLVRRHHQAMRRVASSYVQTPSIADEVVQETWLAVLRGLDRFEGRCTLKTWIFRILINRAQSRGVREQRTLPFSALAGRDDDSGATVDADRFIGPGEAFSGYWRVPPSRFFALPEERLLAAETMSLVDQAIRMLPERQQEVITLRDIEGWTAEEVCESLELSAANQRVLLHRARASVRAVLESHFVELVPA